VCVREEIGASSMLRLICRAVVFARMLPDPRVELGAKKMDSDRHASAYPSGPH